MFIFLSSTEKNRDCSDEIFLRKKTLKLELKVIIERNYKGAEFNVQKLASEMQLNERSLHCLCKKHLAVSPSQMIRSFKINKVKSLLLNGIKSEEVAKEVGYNCKSSFQDAFKKEEGG